MAEETTNVENNTETNVETTQTQTLSQEHVNKLLAEEKRKHQTKLNEVANQLEEYKKNVQLSEEEKINLTSQIENLRAATMTAEERAKEEKSKLEKNLKSEIDKVTKERDSWQNRFNESTIQRALVDAAIGNEAINHEPIVAMLRSNTRLVEEFDDNGKATGGYVPKVKFNTTNEEGQNITLDLSVDEAVKRMKANVDKYGNLFKSTYNNGMGGNQNNFTNKKLTPSDVKNLDLNTYIKNRDQIRKQFS